MTKRRRGTNTPVTEKRRWWQQRIYEEIAVLYPPPHILSGSEWNGRNPSGSDQIPSEKIKKIQTQIFSHSKFFRVIPSRIRVEKRCIFRSFPTIFWPYSNLIPTPFRPHSYPIPTIFRPYSDLILTIFWPNSDQIPTSFWPKSDQIPVFGVNFYLCNFF